MISKCWEGKILAEVNGSLYVPNFYEYQNYFSKFYKFGFQKKIIITQKRLRLQALLIDAF